MSYTLDIPAVPSGGIVVNHNADGSLRITMSLTSGQLPQWSIVDKDSQKKHCRQHKPLPSAASRDSGERIVACTVMALLPQTLNRAPIVHEEPVVVISGLGRDARDANLHDYFGRYGQIRGIRTSSDANVLIYYDEIEEAERAVQDMNGASILGCVISTSLRTWTKTT